MNRPSSGGPYRRRGLKAGHDRLKGGAAIGGGEPPSFLRIRRILLLPGHCCAAPPYTPSGDAGGFPAQTRTTPIRRDETIGKALLPSHDRRRSWGWKLLTECGKL